MKVKSKLIRTATSSLFVVLILGETFAVASTPEDVREKTIASRRTGNLVIALANDIGKLTPGENDFCVLFQSNSSSAAIDIREVSVDFTLLVGRIHEAPITAHLSQNGADRYCGHIDLGPQYYRPASYYAVVRYVEVTGKKKSARLSLTVR
jgi:hypothetical protein